jgi:hypothetical protein
MANVTIKKIPDDVYREVKDRAKREGRSLNSYVVRLLEADAEESVRRRRMNDGWEEFRKFRRTLPYLSDSTELIREDRESH